MPVPIVRNTMLWQPRPAPNCHSASAHAFASFIKNARPPNRAVNSAQIAIRSQPGRFGGDKITPRVASSGPPQDTPKIVSAVGRSAATSA